MSSDALQTLSPSSFFGSSAATHHHAVSFGAIPGSQPGQLSYGFGLGSASTLNTSFSAQPSTSGWGSLPSWAQKSSQQQSFGQPTASTSTLAQQNQVTVSSSPTSNRRRRRSLSEDDDADDRRVLADSNLNSSPVRVVRNVKKFRSTAQLNSNASHSEAATASLSLASAAREGQDVGKALASLSREQLLGMFTSLLHTQPALRPTIAALLPAPTLSSTLSALTDLERSIISAIPTGAGARAEYVWGRVRGPVEEYLAEARSYLSSFTAAINSPSPTVSSEDDLSHPSTTFAFLYALTSSLRRLEVALPPAPSVASAGSTASALSAHLLPLAMNAWHVFLTRLSTSVNEEGKILPASTVQTWFQRLEEVCVASPAVAGRPEGQARKACEGVRDRLRKEVGWLIGLREVATEEMEEEL